MESAELLVKRIQQGDVLAFRHFFEEFYPSLVYVAEKYLREDTAASDIVQDAFLYYWNRRSEIHSILSAKVYLYKYVKHRCLNYLRDRHSRENKSEALAEDIRFRNLILEDETYAALYKAIYSLPPQSQKVLELTLEGRKNHEIADDLGIAVNTVKTIKLRAYRTLRAELKDVHFVFFMFRNPLLNKQAGF